MAEDAVQHNNTEGYSDQMKFDSPVRVRGTNAVLNPNEAIRDVEVENSQATLEEVIQKLRTFEDGLEAYHLLSITQFKVIAVSDSAVVLGLPQPNNEMRLFYFRSPLGGGDVHTAFNKFSSVLKIPSSFSAKNPGFLNQENFSWYLNALTADEKPLSVEFLVHKEADPINVELNEGKTKTYHAQHIVSFRKVRTSVVKDLLSDETSAEENQVELENPVLYPTPKTKVLPLLSRVLSTFKNSEIGDKLKVTQYSFVSEKTLSEGQFALKLRIGDSFEIKGPNGPEVLVPIIQLSSDIYGGTKDQGKVYFTFGIFREVCSNGMTAPIDDSFVREIQRLYLEQNPLPEEDDNEDSRAALRQRVSDFFQNRVEPLTATQVNAGLEVEFLIKALQSVGANLKDAFLSSFEALSQPFEEIEAKSFVEYVHLAANETSFPSGEVIKHLIMEYLSGEHAKDQKFKSPWDIVNYITFVARSFNMEKASKLERVAIPFAKYLDSLVRGKSTKSDLYESYQGKLREDKL